jgi:hypothetical protein
MRHFTLERYTRSIQTGAQTDALPRADQSVASAISGIWWSGVHTCTNGTSQSSPSCGLQDMATVIDAKTGAFVVGGTA